MLKNISGLLSPCLLKTLAEMGHGDEIVIADRNFPAYSIAESTFTGEVHRIDGAKACDVLSAVCDLFPLDIRIDKNVFFMTVGGDFIAPTWDGYRRILSEKCGNESVEILYKQDFYDRAKKAFAVVITGEDTRCANIIIRKGTI